ncbi:hypothetical protein [Dickeya chrysanthemi]|uniref:Uncharacterized protein n=1 Tax=Dickeya chrysanthemi TaxID=556 RepID=A0ABU8JHF8_DICCH|nr:hypothetical protein [Dickeya chrysanthemi]MBX9446280.1 hypothetical protein [Dickeya chrysanthemi]MCA7006689.1 hypothetical protein [Dickeya chrysanthemi]
MKKPLSGSQRDKENNKERHNDAAVDGGKNRCPVFAGMMLDVIDKNSRQSLNLGQMVAMDDEKTNSLLRLFC